MAKPIKDHLGVPSVVRPIRPIVKAHVLDGSVQALTRACEPWRHSRSLTLPHVNGWKGHSAKPNDGLTVGVGSAATIICDEANRNGCVRVVAWRAHGRTAAMASRSDPGSDGLYRERAQPICRCAPVAADADRSRSGPGRGRVRVASLDDLARLVQRRRGRRTRRNGRRVPSPVMCR